MCWYIHQSIANASELLLCIFRAKISLVLSWVLAQKKIKEGWWFYDQSTFVVFTYSLDHIKIICLMFFILSSLKASNKPVTYLRP